MRIFENEKILRRQNYLGTCESILVFLPTNLTIKEAVKTIFSVRFVLQTECVIRGSLFFLMIHDENYCIWAYSMYEDLIKGKI
jgi:hypothetical protein